MSALNTSAASALAAAANAKQVKANPPAKAPASPATARKPRTNTKAPAKAQMASQAPAQGIAAQLAAVVAAPAPKVAKAPRSAPATSYILTPKGAAFTPDPKRSRVKHEGNQVTWLAIKALFTGDQPVTASQIWAAVPTHKDFVGYAVRSGWLAVI